MVSVRIYVIRQARNLTKIAQIDDNFVCLIPLILEARNVQFRGGSITCLTGWQDRRKLVNSLNQSDVP
jgi:hypothetical protein